MKNFRFIDLFCGGGGSITGAINALRAADVRYEGRGFNHWALAIQTIQLNHPEIVPDFEKAVSDIADVNPWEVFANDPERIDVLWASPSCTHHSNAAAGRPRSNQLRSQPEHILPFLRLTKCRRLLVENVKELLSWGPLLDKPTRYKGKLYPAGHPDPRHAGQFFNLWYREVKASGYNIDYQILNAADYGAATSRERLIIQAVRRSTGERIIWPEPTHTREPGLLANSYQPWRSAADIIDWSNPGESIFERSKPLCPNTLRRIEAGIKKYWGAWAEPFWVVLRGTSDAAIRSTAIPISSPLPTLTTGSHVGLCQGFLSRYNGGVNRNHAVNAPLPVIDCGNRYSLIRPVLIDQSHPGEHSDCARCRSKEPLGTITCRNNWSCVTPLFIPQQSAGTVKPTSNPVPTIATAGAVGLIEPLVVPYKFSNSSQSAREPLPTLTTVNNFAVVAPFLIEYYSRGRQVPVTSPVPAISTHDRFGVIQGRIYTAPDGAKYKLDILYRMLTASELARATGFPEGYQFAGGDTAAKKQIGNAVCPDLAQALYRAILAA